MASLETKHPRRDYVEDGYVARSRSDELAGPNYECWITEQCRDVSAQVLAAAAAAVETETEIARGEGFENEFVPSMDTDDDDENEAARVQNKTEQFDDEFTTRETPRGVDLVLERANRLRNIRQELAQQAQTQRLEDQASTTMAADNVRCDVVSIQSLSRSIVISVLIVFACVAPSTLFCRCCFGVLSSIAFQLSIIIFLLTGGNGTE